MKVNRTMNWTCMKNKIKKWKEPALSYLIKKKTWGHAVRLIKCIMAKNKQVPTAQGANIASWD